MRDYLNSNETNQVMVILALTQLLDGTRRMDTRSPHVGSMREDWKKRDNLTKSEHRSLKTAETYLKKFTQSVYDRLSPKEQQTIAKKLAKFDFRLIDDYTLKKIYRETSNRMVNAVVPREQFNDWTEQVMEANCKGCTKGCGDCPLFSVFEDNFIPESGYELLNCKFAYAEEPSR